MSSKTKTDTNTNNKSIPVQGPACSKISGHIEVGKFNKKHIFKRIVQDLKLLEDSKMTKKRKLEFLSSRAMCPKCESISFVIDWSER